MAKFLAHSSSSILPRMLRKSPGISIATCILMVLFIFMVSNKSYSSSHLSDPKPISEASMSNIKIPTSADIRENIPSLSTQTDINQLDNLDDDDSSSVPFMPKMANETLKAELGNAAWKLFHTILARYPDEPTAIQRAHLNTYIESFAQVYPCGDCARHFVKLLASYPPQLGSRQVSAVWGCHIHNKVNEKLGKPEYDCANILEDYDCGCGSDEEEEDSTLGGKSIKAVSNDGGKQKAVQKNKLSAVDDETDETDVHLKSIKIESKESNVGG